MIQNVFSKLEKFNSFFKRKFFHERIEHKKIKYKRKYERDMEVDEIEEYKFKLFIFNSLLICVPVVFTLVTFISS